MAKHHAMHLDDATGIPIDVIELGKLILNICIAREKRGHHCLEVPVGKWSLNHILVLMEIILAYEVDALPVFDVALLQAETPILQITTWDDPEKVYGLDDSLGVKRRWLDTNCYSSSQKKRRLDVDSDTL